MGESIPKISQAEFQRRIYGDAERRHLPINGSFELTYRCNFECVHCYEQDVRDTPELSTARWLELVDQVADQGCLYLTLTGGEALLHPGFEAIYERAVRRGLLVTVFSNGSTLTERVADLFRRLPPRSVEVSLYGFSAQTYARSTGRARGFLLAKAGVERMRALGLNVQVKTVVFDETAGDFAAIRDYAKEVGASFRFDTTVHGALGGSQAPQAHRLSPEQLVALEAAEEPLALELVRARHATAERSDRVYRCGAGRYAFNVAPDGHLQLCTLVRSLRFDLATTDFGDAWAQLGTEVQRRYQSTARRCSGCELRHMCGTCPGIADLEHGDVEAAIDHICETTHLRASQALGRTIVPRWKQAGAAQPPAAQPPAAKLKVLNDSGESHGGASGKACGGGCSGCPSAV